MAGRPKIMLAEQNAGDLDFHEEYELDCLDVSEPSGTSKTTYDANEQPIKVVYYKNTTQTTANRIGESNTTFNAGGQPTMVVNTIYKTTDGTALLKTITTTYTYSGDMVDSTTTVQS